MIQNIYIRMALIALIIVASMTLPQITQKEDSAYQQLQDNVWQEFEETKIAELVAEGRVVFVQISADWCVTCKYNKLVLLNRQKMLNLLQKEKVIGMLGDITQNNLKVEGYMMRQKLVGIPYYAIYGPSAKEGIELPVLVQFSDVQSAIKIAKGQ